MDLAALIAACDTSMPIVIINTDGVGGARDLVPPGEGLTVLDVEGMCCPDLYSVGSIEMRDGALWVYADEKPWRFESYEKGEFYGVECQEYEVEYRGTVTVVEPTPEDAVLMATEIIEQGDGGPLRMEANLVNHGGGDGA